MKNTHTHTHPSTHPPTHTLLYTHTCTHTHLHTHTHLLKLQGSWPTVILTLLPALRWVPSMVRRVPPERGPWEGCTLEKNGDWRGRGRGGGVGDRDVRMGVWGRGRG